MIKDDRSLPLGRLSTALILLSNRHVGRAYSEAQPRLSKREEEGGRDLPIAFIEIL